MSAHRPKALMLTVATCLVIPASLAQAHEHDKKPAGKAAATAPATSDVAGAQPEAQAAKPAGAEAAEKEGNTVRVSVGASAETTPPEAQPKGNEVARPTYHRALGEMDWRQRIRRREGGASRPWLEPGHFLFELRFGPYLPNVDDEFSDAGCAGKSLCPPYESFFGSDPRFYFGVEVNWLPLRIPYVGSLGLGAGWGYVSASAKAKTEETSEDGESSTGEAGSDTSLNIFPMYLTGVVRLDGPLRKWGLPIAPYAKVGLGIGSWSVSGSDGTAVATAADGSSVTAEGTSIGMHVALGASVALNAFDPTAAIAMREETGIRYAYLWGEWMYNDLGRGSDDQLLVGTSTAVFGLGLDF